MRCGPNQEDIYSPLSWESGVTTITHFNPAPTTDCRNLPVGGCPEAGVDIGAAVPFAWFNTAGGHPGNCADGLTCQNGNFPTDRDGELLCFEVTGEAREGHGSNRTITVLVTTICGGNCPNPFGTPVKGVCGTAVSEQLDCAVAADTAHAQSFEERFRCSPSYECAPYVKKQIDELAGAGTWERGDRSLVTRNNMTCVPYAPVPKAMLDWCSGFYPHLDLAAGNHPATNAAYSAVCGGSGANCAARYKRVTCPAIPASCMQ